MLYRHKFHAKYSQARPASRHQNPKINGNIAKTILDLVVALYKILHPKSSPDIAIVVLLYDALERLKKYFNKHRWPIL